MKSNSNTKKDQYFTGFYSHAEGVILADTYYKIGNDLYQSILPKLLNGTPTNEDVWRLNPAFVNLSFSCEIVLKLIYENEFGKMIEGHKLYKELFTKLSKETQNVIADLTIGAMKSNYESEYTYEMFIDDLKKSENTFSHERYSFEIRPGQSHGLQCAFLLTFSHILNVYVKCFENRW